MGLVFKHIGRNINKPGTILMKQLHTASTWGMWKKHKRTENHSCPQHLHTVFVYQLNTCVMLCIYIISVQYVIKCTITWHHMEDECANVMQTTKMIAATCLMNDWKRRYQHLTILKTPTTENKQLGCQMFPVGEADCICGDHLCAESSRRLKDENAQWIMIIYPSYLHQSQNVEYAKSRKKKPKQKQNRQAIKIRWNLQTYHHHYSLCDT